MDSTQKFCSILRKRSSEHAEAMSRLAGLSGMMVSVLRQELDSMMRVIFLLSESDLTERERLIRQTLDGEVWTVLTVNGKNKKVTDREMVELSNQLQGWTLSVYKFGCAFIHFSAFHDYSDSNPFEYLSTDEKTDILSHLRYYHGGPQTDNPSFQELASFFPRVFEKIAGNLECYIKNTLCREYGMFQLPTAEKHRGRMYLNELANYLLQVEDVEKQLDIVELSFRVINRITRKYEYLRKQNASERVDAAIDELNTRFKEHGIGFQFVEGEIVRMDSELLHSEAVKPALRLLNEKNYRGAQQEFLSAYEHYRHGKNKEALNDCLKPLKVP